MLIAAIAIATGFQVVSPSLPEGVHPVFQASALAVSRAMAVDDFDQAAKLAEMLPRPNLAIAWDDSAVNAASRSDFVEARDKAIDFVTSGVPTLSVKIADQADIRFRFVSDRKGGAELVFGTHPRLEVRIPVERNEPITAPDVMNEVAHSIGVYLGVAENPNLHTSMHAFDTATKQYLGLSRAELVKAQQTLTLATALRDGAASKRKIVIEEAKMVTSPERIELGNIKQGIRAPFKITLKNTSKGALRYTIIPDCGCFSRPRPAQVPAGETVEVEMQMDTAEFRGVQNKTLTLITNDSTRPIVEIPVSVNVVPAYRFLRPEGDVILVPDSGGVYDFYLVFPGDGAMNIEGAQIDGIEGKVTYSAWSGKLADEEMGEPETERKGYRVRVKLGGMLPPGRVPATISLATNSARFPILRYNLYAQKGILAMPEQIYLGEIGKTPRRAGLLVSRPGRPFKVVNATSTSPNVKVSFKALPKGDEYRVDVLIEGNVPVGDFSADVVIRTDDPKQPTIRVPIVGRLSP